MTIRILPAPTLQADARSVLADLVLRRMLEPASAGGLELTTTEPTLVPSQTEVCWTASGAWLLVAPSQDPTSRNRDRRIPVPMAEEMRLALLEVAGVEPDLVWLAHQLPATWAEGEAIPDLVPAPPRLRHIDEMLLGPVRGAKKLASLIKIAGRSLPAGLTAIAEVGLDPVVLGGVVHPSLPVVQWAILAEWTWD
jgi:hypothetical protein